jgi:hypothetical protein
MKQILTLTLSLVTAFSVKAQSTINPAAAFAWAANLGWLNLRPSTEDGVVIGSYVCSGYAYGANTGWMNFGNGNPQNHVNYSNADSSDFGVNHDGAGALIGLAYGAAIGWINFEQSWDQPPHIDLTTGAMSGYAYAANCGWISLQGLETTLKPGQDTELIGNNMGDGIPDAWEYQQLAAAGKPPDLALLGSAPAADADHDGVSDLDEYLADTNPFSGSSLFIPQPLHFNPNGSIALSWIASPRRIYQVLCSTDLSLWLPEGPPVQGSSRLITPPANTHRFFIRVAPTLPLPSSP